MSSDLVIPGNAAPNNLRLPDGTKAVMVESDMYDICNRVKDISPNLFIVFLQNGDDYQYAIMEDCKDGMERLVYKVRELDGRVIEKLQYLMKVPLNDRLEQLEKEEHKLKHDAKEDELNELYERMGAPMQHQLIKDGFADRRSFYRKDPNRRRN